MLAADLAEVVTEVIDRLGYVGVAVLVALESLFPPIPSEVVLPLAGFVAGRGDASPVGMVLAATAGSVVGAWVLYGVSASIGPERLHGVVARHGRWLRIRPADLSRAEAWFDRRANAAVLLGRCVPLIRSIISVPAGFRRMPFWRFTVLSAAGSLLWNSALIAAGVILGDRWGDVGEVMDVVQAVVVVVVVVLLARLAWRRAIRPRPARAGSLPPPEDDPSP